MKILHLALGAALFAGAAFAQDATVAARQEAMKTVAASTKVLGDMATDKAPFDTAKAEEARLALASAAASIPTLFQTEATDPKSEAKPEIWQNWDDFTAKAAALETAATGADASSLDAVKAAMGQIGPTCRACHTDYRL